MMPGKSLRAFRRVAALGVLPALAVGLSSCSGFFTPVGTGKTGSGTTSYIYVTHAGGTIGEFSLASGVLTELSNSPATLPEVPTCITIAPNNNFLYVGTSFGVFLYTINSDGTLTEGNSDTVVFISKTVANPIESMAIDPSSSWLIVAYQNSTEIDALPVDSTTGIPSTSDPYAVAATGSTATPKITISPADTQVFVALGTGGVNAFGFNYKATSASPFGSTVSIAPSATNRSDNSVAVDSTSTYLFIAEANNTTASNPGQVRMLATAKLTEADLSDIATGVGPSAIVSVLNGTVTYVYTTNETDGTISASSLDSTTQVLSSLGTFPTEASPVGIVVDSANAYLIDAGSGANPDLWLYAFDGTSLGSLDVKTTMSTNTINPAASNGIAITY